MQMQRLWRKWLLMPFAVKYVRMPGRSSKFSPIELSELERQLESAARLHVEALATTIGERHKQRPDALQAAREYISSMFERFGYEVERHEFEDGVNLAAHAPIRTHRTIIVGAHFDTVPDSPGANDNGSGVAAMLELARIMRSLDAVANIRFVAFDNEEHVGQPATAMGSHVYAQRCKEREEEIIGMWSLETLGYFSHAAGSQRYPSPFDLFYPTTGDFLAFVGNHASREWVNNSVTAFRKCAAFPSEGAAPPQKFADVNRSDHWGFWQAGYPALMVTDTANFRYPHYHSAEDTADKVSYRELARVIRVLSESLAALAAK